MPSSSTLRSASADAPLTQERIPTWSGDMAYATGLVATDGHLTRRTHVGFGSTDLELVETFLHCLNKPVRYSTVPAGRLCKIGGKSFETRRDYYMADINDPVLYRFFEGAGITPRKSRTLASLNVPTQHLPDTIRGLLDGDGSVMVVARSWRGAARTYEGLCLRVAFYSGSRKHLEWLRSVLADLAIRSSIQEDRRYANPCFQLILSDKQATALLTTLYEDPRAPRLQRKWQTWNRYRQVRSLPDYYAFL